MRRAGTGAWAGLFNTHFFVFCNAATSAEIYTNSLPFVTEGPWKAYGDFERALYASCRTPWSTPSVGRAPRAPGRRFGAGPARGAELGVDVLQVPFTVYTVTRGCARSAGCCAHVEHAQDGQLVGVEVGRAPAPGLDGGVREAARQTPAAIEAGAGPAARLGAPRACPAPSRPAVRRRGRLPQTCRRSGTAPRRGSPPLHVAARSWTPARPDGGADAARAWPRRSRSAISSRAGPRPVVIALGGQYHGQRAGADLPRPPRSRRGSRRRRGGPARSSGPRAPGGRRAAAGSVRPPPRPAAASGPAARRPWRPR